MKSQKSCESENFQSALNSRLSDSSWNLDIASRVRKRRDSLRRKYYSITAGVASAAVIAVIFTAVFESNKISEPVYESFISDQVNKTYLSAVKTEMIVDSEIQLSEAVLSDETDLLISEALVAR